MGGGHKRKKISGSKRNRAREGIVGEKGKKKERKERKKGRVWLTRQCREVKEKWEEDGSVSL